MSAHRRNTPTLVRTARPGRRSVGLSAAAVMTTAGLVGLGLQVPAMGAGGGAGEAGRSETARSQGAGTQGAGSQGAERSAAGQAKASQQRDAAAGRSGGARGGSAAAPQAAERSDNAGSATRGRSATAGQPQGHAYGTDKEQGAPAAPARAPQASAAGTGQDGSGAADADPAGNNGTVKIAPLGERDGIPQNTAHPGCSFQVEWYGFDGGDDVVSTVSFAAQAPTSDALVDVVSGDTSVPVGEDAASGAGTETGLDAVETYTLAFDGEPHPLQGYHLKLTVSTPHSLGNDTKTKVFWVEPCLTESAPSPAFAEGSGDTVEEAPLALDAPTAAFGLPLAASGPARWVLGSMEVLGASLQAAGAPGPARAAGAPALDSSGAEITGLGPAGVDVVAATTDASAAPSAIDAGLSEAQRAALTGLVAALLGAAVAFGALVTRRRSARS